MELLVGHQYAQQKFRFNSLLLDAQLVLLLWWLKMLAHIQNMQATLGFLVMRFNVLVSLLKQKLKHFVTQMLPV
jgi:hypothetical protein